MGLNDTLERMALELNEIIGTLRVAMDDAKTIEGRVSYLEEQYDESKDTSEKLEEIVMSQEDKLRKQSEEIDNLTIEVEKLKKK